ncbi:STAS/SEC14 domain-containing protein [Paracoccus salsus]|uniref:STAS/SEC14 domain-containing protein n=1 Tax=Paracoccus salsus TaxID=2911061 RepID=UPI001F1D347C|nr:STAS/SEC14 domain-containing protein [Paracoccus salsus]MCF3972536.1 STAS/SEC14 domain-containing protein [Paracoccus salsus]
MLNIEVDSASNVITARPDGPLPAADFEAMGRAIDDYINAHDRMPGLVVHLKGLPHWQGLSAMRAHFEVVRKHGLVLPRVAIVTDARGLWMLPNLADIFVRARVRHFDVRQEDAAVAWAGSPEKEPEGYVLLDGFPDAVIAIRAIGEVTSRDYEDRLIPLVRKMESRHGRVRLLMQVGPDFERYTAGAMWDDARLGLTHWRSFERVAVVSDIGWIARGVKMFAPLMPGEVAVFPSDAMDAARSWIAEGLSTATPDPGTDAAPDPVPDPTPDPTPAQAASADAEPLTEAEPRPAARTDTRPAARKQATRTDKPAKPAAATRNPRARKAATKPDAAGPVKDD